MAEGGLLYYKATPDGEIADENSPLYTRAQEIKYNVTWGQEADLECTTDPANGSMIFKPLENVYIKFSEPVTPTYGLLATLKWPDGSTVHYPLDGTGNEDKTKAPYQYKVTYSEMNERFMIGLHYPQMKGKYELIVPAGIAKTADGKINKELTITVDWTEREVVDVDLTTDPENGASLSVIPQEIFINIPANVAEARLSDGGITTVLFFTPGAPSGVNRYVKEAGKRFYIDLRESFEYSKESEGLYTIQIPAGTFICTMKDGTEVFNSSMIFSWRLTTAGISEVVQDDPLVTVYDLNGHCVLQNAKSQELKALKGIYIVNGVKTVLH